jgi:hypothetical protein
MKATTKKIVDQIFKGFCLSVSGFGVGWLIGLSVSPVVHIVITSLIAFVVSVTSALAGLKVNGDKAQPNNTVSSRRKLRIEVNPVPMMLMVVGLAFGASLGVYGRTNSWLGPSASRFADHWKDTGLEKRDISRRLFDSIYPPKEGISQTGKSNGAGDITNESNSNSSGAGAPAVTNQNNNQSEASANTSNAAVLKKDVPAKASKTAPATQRPAASTTSSGIATQYFAGVLFSSPSPSDCDRFMTARTERLNEYLTNYRDAKVIAAARTCNGNVGCLEALVRKLCVK